MDADKTGVTVEWTVEPTTAGLQGLLGVVIERLPATAPTPPPGKGTAWVAGYEAAAALAREIVADMRGGVRFAARRGG
jgi:hypothetical protein